jgi:hypothetical protein
VRAATRRWIERNRDLVDLDAAELGLRLLIARSRHSCGVADMVMNLAIRISSLAAG